MRDMVEASMLVIPARSTCRCLPLLDRAASTRHIAALKTPSAAELTEGIQQLLDEEPDQEWRDHIEATAASLLKEDQ